MLIAKIKLMIKEFCENLNNFCIGFNKEKKFVPYDCALRALYYVANIDFKDDFEILLFLVSNNLLNAYVKQKPRNISYYFKSSFYNLFKYVKSLDLNNNSILININKNLLIISFYGLQFSFHNVDPKIISIVEDRFDKKMKWDQVKKQQCALEIFDKVERVFKKEKRNLYKNAKKLSTDLIEKRIDIDTFNSKTKINLPK